LAAAGEAVQTAYLQRSPSLACLLRCEGIWVEMTLETWAVAIADLQESISWWSSCFRPDHEVQSQQWFTAVHL